MKPHLLTRKIVKPHYVTMVLRMFLKLLKSQSIMVIFYIKKTRINDYVDRKYYFDKYFEMTTILIIFFYQWIILDLNSVLESWQTRWARRQCKMVEGEFLSFWWVTYGERKGSQWERHVAKFWAGRFFRESSRSLEQESIYECGSGRVEKGEKHKWREWKQGELLRDWLEWWWDSSELGVREKTGSREDSRQGD